MKKFLGILVLGLFLITPSQADDIRDFQIEGMSLGDSALDFFSEAHIKKNSWDDYPNSGIYIRVQNDQLPFFKTYDAVDFHYKAGDNNYIMQNVSGVIYYDNNIENCYSKMDTIANELSDVFSKAKKSSISIEKIAEDKSGKSKYTEIYFTLKSGYVYVTCYDWSEESGGQPNLKVSLDTKEYTYWIMYEAYKNP